MSKSLLSLQNERRQAERRNVGYERRTLPDRRKKSVPVSEERRGIARRILEQRRMQERRMHEFQKNVFQKDVLEKEEHALITSRGIDEEEMEDNSDKIKEVTPPKYENIYQDDLARGVTESDINIIAIGLAIVGITIVTFILYQFVFI